MSLRLVSVCFLGAFILTVCKPEEQTPQLQSCGLSYYYGYTERLSYYPGETVVAFIQAHNDVSSCALNIYSLSGELAFSLRRR